MSNFLNPKLFLTFGATAFDSESHMGGKKKIIPYTGLKDHVFSKEN